MITKIETVNIKTPDCRVYDDLKQINIIRGANASGKTAVIDAITLALTGSHAVGKTGPAIFQLSAGESMRATVEDSERGSLTNAWQRTAGGSIRRVEGDKDNPATLLTAEAYMEATAKGRFALLARDSSGALDIEAQIAGIKTDLTIERRELKRLEATLKSESLALSKLEALSLDPTLIDQAAAWNDRRIAARSTIAAGAERQIAEDGAQIKTAADFENVSDADLAMSVLETEARIRALEHAVATTPTAEVVEGLRLYVESLTDQGARERLIRQEWLDAGRPQLNAKIVSDIEGKRSLANSLRAAADLLAGNLTLPESCPVCQGHLDPGSLERIRLAGFELNAEVEALEERIEAEPVSESDIRRSLEQLGRANMALAKALEAAEKNAGAEHQLVEQSLQLGKIRAESQARLINDTRTKVKAARGVMAEATTFFERNANTIEQLEVMKQTIARIATLIERIEKSSTVVAMHEEEKQRLEIKFKTICADMLGSIIEAAETFLTGIVDGTVVNYGSEIFIQRENALIGWSVMSGSERLAIGAAIKTAVSSISGILLVDEIGVLAPAMQERFIANIESAVGRGAIQQAFIIIPIDASGLDVVIESRNVI